MAEDADLFDNDAERYRFFLNVFKDSEDEIWHYWFNEYNRSFIQDWDRPGGNRCCLQNNFEGDILDKLPVFKREKWEQESP